MRIFDIEVSGDKEELSHPDDEVEPVCHQDLMVSQVNSNFEVNI